MDLQLSGKVALVTGASRGIGYAIAQTLRAEGMRVAVVARDAPALETFAGAQPADTLAFAADLRQPDAPAAAVVATVARFGGLDVLVNNAGATRRGDLFALSDEDWHDGFALKFYAAMRASRAAWPHLRASAGGIVNIIGIGGRTGSKDFGIGGAVNAALMNLTKVLADRGVEDGVRVNAINPGSIATDRLTARLQAFAADRHVSLPDAEQQMARAAGVSRFGRPEEIANLVAFLASPRAAFCQGTVLDADGGQTRTL
jgi:3-oxoacyl-[acyl-carrier protein] reductase